VIAPQQADRLRAFVASRRATPAADEEHFRLVDGLGDVMTSAGLVLLLGAISLLFTPVTPAAGLLLLPCIWWLAERFTRRNRLTLTSGVLFVLFVLTTAMTLLHVALLFPGGDRVAGLPSKAAALPALGGLVVAAGSGFACAAWWYRFRLPIAYAAAVIAALNVLVHLARLVAPDVPTLMVSLLLLVQGLSVLLLAIWWDMSDIRRETRRSSIAFWLHAVAGFLLAGASFRLIFGVLGDPVGWERLYVFVVPAPDLLQSIIALLLFSGFCGVALLIDRRSLVLSSLVFVFAALKRASLFPEPAAPMAAAMMIGLLLILLSSVWTRLRASLLKHLPAKLQAQVPRTEIAPSGARPVA
jgi:hypothetical protein